MKAHSYRRKRHTQVNSVALATTVRGLQFERWVVGSGCGRGCGGGSIFGRGCVGRMGSFSRSNCIGTREDSQTGRFLIVRSVPRRFVHHHEFPDGTLMTAAFRFLRAATPCSVVVVARSAAVVF